MGCPNSIVNYLASLQEVKKINFYPDQVIFQIALSVLKTEKFIKNALIQISLTENRTFKLLSLKKVNA